MKHIAIDIGNVLCEVKFDNFIRELSRTLDIPIEDVDYFLHRTTKLHDLGITQIADELRDHFKIKSPVIIEDLVGEWNKVIIKNYIMMEFLSEIMSIADVALLSNIGIEHATVVRTIFKSIYNYNAIEFFSCEVGARKPTFLYYKTFLDMYPDFKGCIYLDDRVENIRVGEKFGFNSIHFILDTMNQKELKNKLTEIKSLI